MSFWTKAMVGYVLISFGISFLGPLLFDDWFKWMDEDGDEE
jgi:hypothetical protein